MSDGRLYIELEPQVDKNGHTFYVGKLKAPVLIDAKDGISFLVFTAQSGNEVLQISSFTKPKNKDNQ